MTTTAAAYKDGLEDVIAARSAICRVDGEAGRLYYRGYEIADLVGGGQLRGHHAAALGRRAAVGGRARGVRGAARGDAAACRRPCSTCCAGCRASATRWTPCAPRCRWPRPPIRTCAPTSRAANLRKAFRLMTLVPATVAAWQRIRTGREPVAARPDGSHAAHFLYMLDGKEPVRGGRAHPGRDPHAARRPRAQRLDVRGARRGGHGGRHARRGRGGHRHAEGAAPRRRQRGRAGHAARDRRACAGRGLRRGADRRARRALQAGSRAIPSRACRASATASTRWTTRGRGCCAAWPSPWRRPPGAASSSRSRSALYDAMKARTSLPVNVDFFSAVVYDALGIPPDFCTSIFAVGRVAGWCAHVMEQYADNRLIRPRADYIGQPARALP